MEEFDILYNEEAIQKRVKELARQIYDVYQDEEVVFVCTLKGAVFFCVDLMKSYPGDAKIEFIKIHSYDGENTSGEVDLDLPVTVENIENKNILIVEDIIDTGLSLEYLYKYLDDMNPKKIEICVLLDKYEKRVVPIKVDYIGFTIEDLFVIGYGLDYNQKYRNLPCIKVLKK